jgi:hypothetical protein
MRSDMVSASSWSWVTKIEGDAGLALHALELHLHLLAEPPVERRQRLVEQQHPRLRRERAGERDALLLAAGELASAAAAEPA